MLRSRWPWRVFAHTQRAAAAHLELVPRYVALQHLHLCRRHGHPELLHGGQGQRALAARQLVQVLGAGVA
jgi:ABC-type lipoprotein export system ATPase subunit